jgi:pimeloyl-ACP methyl ester carboxylesterase
MALGNMTIGSRLNLAALILAGAFALALPATGAASTATRAEEARQAGDVSIRPFRAHVPDAAIADMRRRLRTTRWPDRETVADRSQGVQLARLQELVRYWGSDYDWRRAEARLNALPQFTTTIDGVEIHFIHIRSRHPNALPVIISHGWPGSVFEQLKLIGPLTDPTAYGGRAQDAFDVVIPSLPGYGFSARPAGTGWGPDRIGRAWDILMKRLGYTRYVAQGGDWGSVIVEAMGRQAPAGLLGIHVNLPAAVPPDVAAALAGGGPAPAGLSERERAVFDSLRSYAMAGNSAYFTMLTARPQAVGYGMADSPAGLAAFLLVHPGFANWSFGDDPRQSPTRDDVLDNFSLYWLTNSAVSAARLYWENGGKGATSAAAHRTSEISIPVAVTVFPEEVYRAPESWAHRAFPNLLYFHEAERGGHFAAWEQPELFAGELRVAFRTLR